MTINHLDQAVEYWNRVKALVSMHGWAVQGVGTAANEYSPPFSYTIGLSAKGYPDLLILGLDIRVGQMILNAIAHRMWEKRFEVKDGVLVDEAANVALCLKTVDATLAGEFATGAFRYARECGHTATVMQAVFPDKAGRYPWDAGCDARMSRSQDMQLVAQEDLSKTNLH